MKIAVLKEMSAGEQRVAATPETVKKYVALGCEVAVEASAGEGASISDEAFRAAGAKVVSRKDALASAEIVIKVQRPEAEELAAYPRGALLLAVLGILDRPSDAAVYAKHGINAYAMELIPRISRAQSMDVLSSQSNLAGYKAVIEAASIQTRVVPMMMTAAGTVTPCKILVLGAGVAGLQAIATARRLGGVVSAFDVRPAVKEQVQSLGASFVDVPADPNEQAETSGGYAKEMSAAYQERQKEAIHQAVSGADIVISTALIPGKKAPILVTKTMVEAMAPGGVLVDLAAPAGGNCELTVPGKRIRHGTVTIVGDSNMVSSVATDAARLYARNMLNLIQLLVKKDDSGTRLQLDHEDAIVKEGLISWDGKLVHERFKDIAVLEAKPAAIKTPAAKKPKPAAKPATTKAKTSTKAKGGK